MRLADASERFRAFAATAGVEIDAANAAALVAVMADWYRVERAEDVDVIEGGDMLLFQWGTYDWGDGPTFEYDITRQLVDENDADDDGAIWQLSVTAHYPETTGASAGSGNHWCDSPDDLEAFLAMVEACVATRLVADQHPSYVAVRYEQAG